jgi:two-component sensor histidine kinase
MDTAVPLGIIVNELVSNALKHAFPEGKGGEIRISLLALKDSSSQNENGTGCKNEGDFQFILIVADNGTGIPESLDFSNTDSLGLQLVNLLVEQIDGCIELKRDSGTEFRIMFRKAEK